MSDGAKFNQVQNFKFSAFLSSVGNLISQQLDCLARVSFPPTSTPMANIANLFFSRNLQMWVIS
jgi:hypothetical protein